MDPWTDACRRPPKTPVNTDDDDDACRHKICPEYPQCPKEERKFLNEVRAMGANVPLNIKLSNGMCATDFCLQYIMNNHFKPKLIPNTRKK